MLARHTQPAGRRGHRHELQRWERWLQYPEGQVNALRATAPTIAAMPPSHVGRQVARLAIRLSMTHATVTAAVTDALTELIQAPGMSPGGSPAPPRARRGGPGSPG